MRTLRYLQLALGLLATLLLAPAAAAQTLAADWAVPCASGPAPDPWGPQTLAVDAAGNTYVAGSFAGTVTLGPATLSALQTLPGYFGPTDVFLAKLNAQGQYLWAVQLGDGQVANPSQLVVDPAGEVYLTGGFYSYSLQFGAGGPLLYNSSASGEGFVARFSGLDGHCRWARRFGGTGADKGNALTISALGDIYVAGETGTGTADFGPVTLPTAPVYTQRGFLAKLSAAGTWLWAQQLGSNGQVSIAGLVLDGRGGIYVAGSFSSPGVLLGTATLATHMLTGWGNAPGADAVVAKYTETGNFKWAVQGDVSGGNYAFAGAPVYDGQGHLYVAGKYGRQSMHLGSLVLPNFSIQAPQPVPTPPVPYTDNYYSDAFVARLDTAGTWQWAIRQGGQYEDETYGLILDGTGRLLVQYISNGYPATSTSPLQLAVLDKTTGAEQTRFPLPTAAGYVYPYCLAADGTGHLYLGGFFTTGSLPIGGATVAGSGAGRSTGFVTRLGPLVLAAQPALPTPQPGLLAWPSPGPGTGVSIEGVPAGQLVEAFDVLGRRVGAGTMPASGPLQLNWAGTGLAAGVYVVRSAGQSCRWVVE